MTMHFSLMKLKPPARVAADDTLDRRQESYHSCPADATAFPALAALLQPLHSSAGQHINNPVKPRRGAAMDKGLKCGDPACGGAETPAMIAPPRSALFWGGVAILLVLAVACRLYPIFATHLVTSDSAHYYLPIAEAVAQGHPLPPRHVQVPILFSQVTGCLARLTGDVELAAKLVSLAGTLLLCVSIFLLALRLFGPYAAFAALALVAFNPYGCEQGTETNLDGLALGWFGAAAFLTVAYLLRPRLGRALALGAVLGLMALTRPEGAVYALLVTALIALFPVEGPLRLNGRRLAHALAALALAVCLCLPRLCQVHREIGWWVIDTRQVTEPAALWQKIAGGPAQGHDAREMAVENEKRGLSQRFEWFVGAFGPGSLLFGVYGICCRRRRLRIEWAPAALMAAGLAVVAVGPGATRRYFLPMSALWQIWAAVGLIGFLQWLVARLAARRRPGWKEFAGPPLVLAAAAVISIAPVLWFVGRIDRGEQAVERAAGQWLLAQYGRGQPILSSSPNAVWYARGEWMNLPDKQSKTSAWAGAELSEYARTQQARFLILDDAVEARYPQIARELRAGPQPFGRIVHETGEGRDRIAVVELSRGG
jgi:4-amino-4-deoxy-L-arabinose transferase-like glycosyltransferase